MDLPEMEVFDCGQLNYFEGHLLRARDWLCIKDDELFAPSDSEHKVVYEKFRLYSAAVIAVSHHKYWGNELGCEPYVGYNPKRDCVYFIFQNSNNGTTFLVGDFPEEMRSEG